MKILRFIKSNIINFLLIIFRKRGFILQESKKFESLLKYCENLLLDYDLNSDTEKTDSIVFSKDRAMQLFAFLKSFEEMVSNKGKMTVIYKASTKRHKKSYNDLISYFDPGEYIFIEEINFRSQLIRSCEESEARIMGLFVDDMVFLRPIDYRHFYRVNPLTHIVSLSRGKDLVYSQVLGKENILPNFKKYFNSLFSFSWNSSIELNDWTYPLGVGGFFYSRKELLSIFKSIDFRNPNTLEAKMQVFLPLFKNRVGLCYEKIACVCVHANIVQDEWNNPILGTFSINELLDKWEKGLCIDTLKFYNKNGMDAKYQTYEFVNRQ